MGISVYIIQLYSGFRRALSLEDCISQDWNTEVVSWKQVGAGAERQTGTE